MSLTGADPGRESIVSLVGCVTPSSRPSWLDEPNCVCARSYSQAAANASKRQDEFWDLMNKLDLTAVSHRDLKGDEKSNQDMPVERRGNS
jgi:hypothetical protein